MLDVESGYYIWEIIMFSLFILLLRAYAWNPLLAALQQREALIRSTIETADKAQRESESILGELRFRRDHVGMQFQKIIDANLNLAERIRNNALIHANVQAQKILEDAQYEIHRYKEKSMQELRMEIGKLTIQLAGQIIEQQLDETRHRKLIDIALNSLPNGYGHEKKLHVIQTHYS